MNEPGDLTFSAVQDFRTARRRATFERILSRLSGRSPDLLSYEEVRRKLHAIETPRYELREIPLSSIVGSLGRYNDFTRSFLPISESSRERWARVKGVSESATGFPPIDVYQIGEAYFVKDGNHRVSVARQAGAKTIQAYVTEVQSDVPLTPEIQPEDLILKAEYADFLDHTRLNELRPGADLTVTVPGEYARLEEHIRVHRYFMGLNQRREISLAEAVAHWYDHIYLPVVEVIRDRGLLRDFPQRTETDLYLWISEHRAALESEFGLHIETHAAALDLAQRFSPRASRFIARLHERLAGILTPDELSRGPSPGHWRLERVKARPVDRLFPEILVALSGSESSWQALDQALIVARHERSAIHGLRVIPRGSKSMDERNHQLNERFQARLRAEGVSGELRLASGRIARRLCEYARWMDLVTLKLDHPPSPNPLQRLSSGFRTLLRNCSRPALVVPDQASPMQHGLLAFDGSDHAFEALYVAAYLGEHWGMQLDVATVAEEGVDPEQTLDRAREYLGKHGVASTTHALRGPVERALLEHARERGVDLILVGGFGSNPVLEAVVGSTVEGLLRQSKIPLLICR
jgi:nucleotide-binding universal stress UspA family protein/uncharacterized ParB-like nuclease family protein